MDLNDTERCYSGNITGPAASRKARRNPRKDTRVRVGPTKPLRRY